MIWLVSASLIWAFSFGLIKGMISGVDPFVLGLIRTGVACLFFAPWYFIRSSPSIPLKTNVCAAICGFLQIGLMYGPYLLSFRYLKSHEVALYTMTTPLIMGLLSSLMSRKGFGRLMMAALLATVGGMVAAWGQRSSEDLWTGIALVQLSNLFFASGILLWTKWLGREKDHQAQLMFPFFGGASFASLILAVLLAKDIRPYTGTEWIVFIYLGAVASGLGFFLWNRGAIRVTTATLTVANNLKLPIAMLVSLTVFGESGNLLQLSSGVALIMLGLRIAAAPLPR